MRYLFIAFLSLSAFLFSEEYEFEPVPNKAEYFSGKFNEGKNMQDLELWAKEFVEWSEDNNWRKSSITSIFTPFFNDDLSDVDYVWLNILPNATEQYSSLGYWLKNSSEFWATMPATNTRVVDVWQWPISAPSSEPTDQGMVRFSRCKLKEGVTLRKAFDVYKKFAIKAKSEGDNMGRKILFGPSGVDDSNFDYVYSLYASSMKEFGESADNFMENLAGTSEADALSDISSCSNARTYIVNNIKQANRY
tara:strand:- start:482 stop:1228 length:747 start_codon:yes stop_codon:yes gene_type:complete